jgi:hypothetical protein
VQTIVATDDRLTGKQHSSRTTHPFALPPNNQVAPKTLFEGLRSLNRLWCDQLIQYVDDSGAKVIKQVEDAWGNEVKWFDTNVWQPMLTSIDAIGKALTNVGKALTDPIQTAIDLWQKLQNMLGIGGAGGWAGGDITRGWGPVAPYRGVWQPPWVRISNRILPSPPPNQQGYVTYEEYPWEGYSSRHGPAGNPLVLGKGVGLGLNVQKQLGIGFGDWVNLGGGLGWRQVNETSSRPWGIEFFTNRPGQYTGQYPRIQVLGTMRAADLARRANRQNAPAVPSPLPSAATSAQPDIKTMSREAFKHLTPEVQQRMRELGVAPGGGGVTINYNVENHFHGGSADIEHRVATQHRAHIDNLKRDVEEVLHRMARASFVNRAAWT